MTFIVEFFRVLATAMNVIMFLSPIPTIREILRTKATGHMPFVPLAAMVSNAHVWMVYGWLAKNYVAIFGSCAFGVAAALVYVSIYYRFTTERAYAHKILGLFGLIIAANSLYAILGANGYTNQSDESVRKIVGYISIASSVVMYTSPLEKIRLVFQHKSAVFIPIHIVSVGAVNAAAWVVFSLLEIDWLVFAPNLFLLLLTLVQIGLYWVFHPAKHPLQLDDACLVDGQVLPTVVVEKDGRRPSVSYVVSPKRHQLPLATSTTGDDRELGFVAMRSPTLAPLQQV